jgi:hypothetical protein
MFDGYIYGLLLLLPPSAVTTSPRFRKQSSNKVSEISYCHILFDRERGISMKE